MQIDIRKAIISYDEYLLIKESINFWFDNIIIIKNPVFYNLFPLTVNIDENIKEALLNHFNDELSDDSNIEGIREYLNIYRNFILTSNGNLACVYNDDDVSANNNIFIETLDIDENTLPETEKISELNNSSNYISVSSPEDCLDLALICENTNDNIICSIDISSLDKSFIENYIDILNYLFPNRLTIYKSKTIRNTENINPEIIDTMKKYWKFDAFRSFRTYDVDALDRNEKKIVNVSQSEIINDIVTQVKNASENKEASDIFVTAPTGAGKSLLFQLPAIYLAEKYNLVTLVISPLIGLMNDQVESLKKKGYNKARTINSDISPVIKNEILDEIATGKCDILYLSPESLLGKSDIEQLIGHRKIGMVVIDESHIVTTWGKQFRPDYWFLGDHITKIRRAQRNRQEDPSSFIIATFTATAIYGGKEDMYSETIISLNMINPITYLGYVKRDNISIDISLLDTKKNRTEYELNKFKSIIDTLKTSIMRNQKTLVYFPTVALIERFYSYCGITSVGDYVVKYHGRMDAEKKNESFGSFRDGIKPIMIATKAFGMGIDIPDIVNVIHFAPTGNVCDYIQEIGRAGRDTGIESHAIYKHMKNDFMHINRLHGLSAIRKDQLIKVMDKILEIYKSKTQNNFDFESKRRNGMTVDAENFAYIFRRAGLETDDSELINKVKTAMLLIQKDAENRSYAPFHMKPVTIFKYGYFNASDDDIIKLNKRYKNVAEKVSEEKNIYKINLEKIWSNVFVRRMSFPKFKYLLYSGSDELEINKEYVLRASMEVEIGYKKDYDNKKSQSRYDTIIKALHKITGGCIGSGKYISIDNMIDEFKKESGYNKFESESIINVFMASVEMYSKKFAGGIVTKCFSSRANTNGIVSYNFASGMDSFYRWLEKNKKLIFEHIDEGKFYIVNEKYNKSAEILIVLGLLESFGIITFSSTGGSNSQIYIYVNETKSMEIATKNPNYYKNKLLDNIKERHNISVAMMTYLYQNNFTSEEIWEHLENYLLGNIPEEIKLIENY